MNKISYAWIVKETKYPEVQLRIWKDGDKSRPIIEERFRSTTITPKFVAEKIGIYEGLA
ncbi:MAG: ribosomal protein S19 family protein [Crocinitomicaceae bacterium]|nr:ribosomal protein S19 family protein [Crocinitomicaceae bacterium]